MGEFAAEAIALVTKANVHQAGERCDLAARAVSDLVPLTDLLAEGRIRASAMAVVAKETHGASAEAVAAVLEHLLAPLRGKPGSIRIAEIDERELRKATRRMLERAEPELLRERAERNRRERLDVRFSEGDVGTADMRATLRTEDALVLKEAVEQAAAERRRLDPTLTAAASRAHGLLDLALRGVEVSAHVRLGIPIITSAASRLSFAPYGGGEGLEGLDRREPYGLAQELHGPTGRGGRFVTGGGADAVDVIPEEWAGDAVTSQVPTAFGPGGEAGWTSGCEIPGVGFIPADAVAAITTHLETRVSRSLIDARTGVLVETSSPRYVVTDSMREFVAARDGTCRMWGCNRRIMKSRCTEHNADLDHATEWPQGPSCPKNLSGLCRHHHRLKHLPTWRHELHEDGRTTWTSPTGEQVETFPELWVHVGDEVSPPPEGAKEEEEKEVEEKGEPAVDINLLFHPNFHGPVPY